jgi:hypothetical protein
VFIGGLLVCSAAGPDRRTAGIPLAGVRVFAMLVTVGSRQHRADLAVRGIGRDVLGQAPQPGKHLGPGR